MEINGKLCQMELDTAADYSIMSKSEYLERFAGRPLTPSKITLRTYTGEVLDVSGEMQCDMCTGANSIIYQLLELIMMLSPHYLAKTGCVKLS